MELRQTACLLACILAFAPVAEAEEVDQTLEVKPGATVVVQVPRGRVDIEGWDRDEVRVTGRLDADTKEFVFRNRGEDTLVEVRLKHENSSWGKDDSDLDIYLPEASALQFRGVSLDVSVHGVAGGVKGGTVSGDLNLENVTRRADVGTVSGDIFVSRCDGRVRLNTVSGDIEVRDCSGEGSYETVSGSIMLRDVNQEEVACETVSGDLVVELAEFKEFRGNAVSGQIELSGDLEEGGRVELQSVSGRVEIALGKTLDARFDVETGSGAIKNQLTNDQPRVSEYSRERELHFTMGEGKGTVTIGTSSGRVVLRAR